MAGPPFGIPIGCRMAGPPFGIPIGGCMAGPPFGIPMPSGGGGGALPNECGLLKSALLCMPLGGPPMGGPPLGGPPAPVMGICIGGGIIGPGGLC